MSYYETLFNRYKMSGIMVDTNIFLMFFVGLCDPRMIPKFNRTKTYTIEDYAMLVKLLDYFEKIVTTPNILTEVSNLAGQLKDPFKSKVFEKFGQEIQILDEHYIPSHEISEDNQFVRFGLTDSAIIKLVKDRYLVLTDDFRLSVFLQKEKVDVLNFNHIRTI